MSHISTYIQDTQKILTQLDQSVIEKMIQTLLNIRQKKGRLFFLGVGGSAANCSHAVNDFRKIAGFEAYTPIDNISELTARVNDEGWETVFEGWLKQAHLTKSDGIFVLSVGGGNIGKKISINIVNALKYASKMGARILGIVGRDGGFTAQVADAALVIPTVNPHTLTAHAEAFQGVIWHLIVSDPRIMQSSNKWESVDLPRNISYTPF